MQLEDEGSIRGTRPTWRRKLSECSTIEVSSGDRPDSWALL